MILKDITKRVIEVETISDIDEIKDKYKNVDVDFIIKRINRFRDGISYPSHWEIQIIYPVGDNENKRWR
ncbi:hypothetical protein ACSXAS_15555 (plasmid) [Clostridium perfringens]|nr:hypothetical protein [Clostridium perfringens]